MIVSKKGAVAALKEAWKKGYEIVPNGAGLSIYTENWALETQTRELPLEVSQTLVEHYGGLPVEPVYVQRQRENQMMMGTEALDRAEGLCIMQEEPKLMHRVPLTFKNRWAMFVTTEGEWLCVDQAYLDILEEIGFCGVMMTDNGLAMFTMQEERLTVAPGKFGPEDRGKLQRIADMYKEQKIREVEMPENLCLFDDMEREE